MYTRLHVSLLVLALLVLRPGAARAACDATPGAHGRVVTILNEDRSFYLGGGPILRGNDRVLERFDAATRPLALARDLPDGRPDPRFGGQGIFQTRPLIRSDE